MREWPDRLTDSRSWAYGVGMERTVIRWTLFGIAIFTVVAILGFEYLGGAGEREAKDACKEATLDALKAPGTAEWVDISAVAASGSSEVFDVTGEVDAENGYGALIRNRFTCTVNDGVASDVELFEK